MQRHYVTVDVFTDRAFGGNPLAVVLNAEGLSTAQMQAVAAEFNYSETTFVLPPQNPAHDAQVRIFTVKSEIPFAGHPNVGTAFVLASRAREPSVSPPARLAFEEKAGVVEIEILKEKGRVIGAELRAPQALKRRSEVTREEVAACLSLRAADIATDRHAPHVVSVGLPFLAVEIASREALRRARANSEAFARTFPLDGSDAVYLYTRDVPDTETPCDIQARMFHPGLGGLAEDPATGSATVALAALNAELDGAQAGELRLAFGQGFDMGRPSLLSTRVRKRDGRIISAHVGGRCAPVMQGTFWLQGGGG